MPKAAASPPPNLTTLTADPDCIPFLAPLNDLAIEDPVAALKAVQALQGALVDTEALAVASARAQGVTWSALALAIEVPCSTLHRAFKHLDPTSPS